MAEVHSRWAGLNDCVPRTCQKVYRGGGWALGLPVKECLRQALNGVADWLFRRGWRSAVTWRLWLGALVHDL